MSDYLSGISSVNASSSVQSSNKKTLTEETKKQLEAFGVDTKNIKTEDEGQKKLKEVQSVQQNQQVQQPQDNPQTQAAQGQQNQQDGSMSTLIRNVKDLASQVGVSIGVTSDIEAVFQNIQTKITEMKMSKVSSVEEDSKAMAASYQTRYDSLYREYESKKQSQSMLTNSLNALAGYNMAMI